MVLMFASYSDYFNYEGSFEAHYEKNIEKWLELDSFGFSAFHKAVKDLNYKVVTSFVEMNSEIRLCLLKTEF